MLEHMIIRNYCRVCASTCELKKENNLWKEIGVTQGGKTTSIKKPYGDN